MEYKEFIDKAIKAFWDIRISQKRTNRTERDNRGAVLGGRQMDGFAEMMKQIALSIGIPSACVFTKGNRPVHNPACHFSLLPEFDNASYMERYRILCRKLILERNYTSVALSWTSRDASYGDVSEDLSIGRFLRSFEGYLKGALHEFQ